MLLPEWPVYLHQQYEPLLTGLVLAIEMTSNYELILPLIITTVTASVITAQLGNEPIYTTFAEEDFSK